MRIRTKLILAIAVPVGLLVAQIVVVNVFIRELQSAVTFISSAHKVIEADFVATELVATMRAEVKQLPARYVTEGGSDSDETPLRQDWEKLTAEIDLIAESDAIRSIDPAILQAVTHAYDTALDEYRQTETIIADDAVDMDTLIERAIFIDKALDSMSGALQMLAVELRQQLQIALDHGATIDKYVGDAILIFFGDPETRGVREDALACVRMAIAMRDRMLELEKVWRAAGIAHPLRCRMGIHTDFCTVGNFGSEDRLDYTIIGRGVNIASRLESLATPGEILISYESCAQVEDEIACEEKGEVKVKGLAYPVTTYHVVGARDGEGPAADSVKAGMAAMLGKDPDAMSAADRRAAIVRLSDALRYLSRKDVDTDAVD